LLFLNKSAEINKQNKDGNTALHLAILDINDETSFEFLRYLEHNPHPELFEITNKKGETVWALASETAKLNPEGQAPIVYAMMLLFKLQTLEKPDLSNEVTIRAYIKEKNAILKSLREQ